MKVRVASVLALITAGCASSSPTASVAQDGGTGDAGAQSAGSLVLSIRTDMQTPKDLDTLSVFVAEGATVKLDTIGRVLPDGTVALPWLLPLPDAPGASVQIRVVGFLGQTALVLRDVQTTVPVGRTATMDVPLDAIDLGSATGTLPAQYLPSPAGGVPEGATTFDPEIIASRCDPAQRCEMPGQACETEIDGVCTSAAVDSSALPSSSQDAGAAGCFSVGGCFSASAPTLTPDWVTCSFPLPSGATAATFNAALVTTSVGDCLSNGFCLVPLPQDPEEGWTLVGDTVMLAATVCMTASVAPEVATSSGTCPPMTANQQVCEPTSGAASGDP
jgi:hypothetical protein